jgi:group I intron endonuclease
MTTNAVVYLLTNLTNGKHYVGVTKNLRRRMRSHYSLTQQINIPIKNAIKEHGRDNFSITVLEEGDIDYCYSRESFWITDKNSMTPVGYNVCTGGRGSRGLTGELNGMFGRKGPLHPNYGKPAYMFGKRHTEETKRLMSATRKGRKASPEAREKMRIASLARSPESRKRAADAVRATYARKREAKLAASQQA